MQIKNGFKYIINDEYTGRGGGGGDLSDTYLFVIPEKVAEAVHNSNLHFAQALAVYALTNIFDSDTLKLHLRKGEGYVFVSNINRFTEGSVLSLVKTDEDVAPMYKLLEDLLDLGHEYMMSSEVIDTVEDFEQSGVHDIFLDNLDTDESRRAPLELLRELGYGKLVDKIQEVLDEDEKEADDE